MEEENDRSISIRLVYSISKRIMAINSAALLALLAFFLASIATAKAREILNVAKLGACEHAITGVVRCAMQASNCEPEYIDGVKNPNGERWYSAYRMEQRGLESCSCETTEVGSCFKPGKADIAGGSGNVEFRCAPHSDSCHNQDGESFGIANFAMSNDEKCGCSGFGDLSLNELSWKTLYGACRSPSGSKDDYFCAYSPHDCEGEYSWVEPNSVSGLFGRDCHCEDTHVGGCVGGFQGFLCAITEDDCAWDNFHHPMPLKKKWGHSCRLCKAGDDNVSPSVSFNDAIDRETQSKNLGIGAILGIVAGSAVGLSLLMLLMYQLVKKISHSRSHGIRRESRMKDKELKEDDTVLRSEDEGKVIT